MKEVLVIEYSKKTQEGHNTVWGLSATDKEIDYHSEKV